MWYLHSQNKYAFVDFLVNKLWDLFHDEFCRRGERCQISEPECGGLLKRCFTFIIHWKLMAWKTTPFENYAKISFQQSEIYFGFQNKFLINLILHESVIFSDWFLWKRNKKILCSSSNIIFIHVIKLINSRKTTFQTISIQPFISIVHWIYHPSLCHFCINKSYAILFCIHSAVIYYYNW